MKVLLDDNFPRSLLHVLRSGGIEADHIITLGWRGLADSAIRDRVKGQDVLFLTQDGEASTFLWWSRAMRCKSAMAVALGIFIAAITLLGQGPAAPPAPWRGAGATPCIGSDGGVYQCPQAPRTIAVRAGRLFDSKTGQMLTRQVVVLQGERILEVGPEAHVRIPVGAQVIDLSQATLLPGLIDAHTHMFNTRGPKMTTEGSTLIAVQNVQADLRAGFTAARDMSSHGNGYGDVEIRDAINCSASRS